MTGTKKPSTAQITIRTPLLGTEDPLLIRQALSTIIDPVDVELKKSTAKTDFPIYQVIGRYDSIRNLKPLYHQLRNQRIIESARSILRRSIRNNLLVLYFHKQAAVSGQIHFCSEFNESPLGPITLEIQHEDFDWFINWLTPATEHGKIIKRLQPFI